MLASQQRDALASTNRGTAAIAIFAQFTDAVWLSAGRNAAAMVGIFPLGFEDIDHAGMVKYNNVVLIGRFDQLIAGGKSPVMPVLDPLRPIVYMI